MDVPPCRFPVPATRCLARGDAIAIPVARAALITVCAIAGWNGTAPAQCPEEPPLANYTGSGDGICPCFIPGEQAGAVFTAPPGDYPLEILRVGIAWSSQAGAPQSLEQAINVYAGGLPDPGSPIFTLPGPLLDDGAFNEFDLEPLAGEIVVPSGPFTVALEFFNQNNNDIFAPSVVFDTGCQAGKNVVYALPGGWSDACVLGVPGDWLFYVIYRPCAPSLGVDDGARLLGSQPIMLTPARPNPFHGGTEMEFVLARGGAANVSVYDLSGRRVAVLADGSFPSGAHRVSWDGRTGDGGRASSGVYFVELRSGAHRAHRTLLLTD